MQLWLKRETNWTLTHEATKPIFIGMTIVVIEN